MATLINDKKRIAILGGGPSGLFMYKRIVETGNANITVDIFERKQDLGMGMPYSREGANDEHVTNVSGNEIPDMVTPISEWIKTVDNDTLHKYNVDREKFNDYKVLPRLLFGQYLSDQFKLLQKKAKEAGIHTTVHYNSAVTDITDNPQKDNITVEINEKEKFIYDHIIVCTGHNWVKTKEDKISGWFDSPYPPVKLAFKANHPIAIKGSSLTAVDAIRTLSRHNGTYSKDENGKLIYRADADSSEFKIVLHSRNGLLPAVRFHLEDSHLENDSLLTDEEIALHIKANDGFLSLDFIFENDFKVIIREKDPEFYARIKDMNMEAFVESMMNFRQGQDAFELMKAEYAEAENSIKKRESIYWKEMLGVLSFAMNYPAKHFSAEDMQRLQKVLQPLISVVIAYIPQSSCQEMMALHDAGKLDIIAVGEDSYVEPVESGGAVYHYKDAAEKDQAMFFNTYIDSVGQQHLSYEDFPFKGLLAAKTVSPARLRFRDGEQAKQEMQNDNRKVETDSADNYYLRVPGIAINDGFQVVDNYGAFNDRIYMMAVPYIGGFNPDYSGLDFSEEASQSIIECMFKQETVS